MDKWSDAIDGDYIGDEGTWTRVDWGGLIYANVKGLIALIGGLMVTAAGAFPRSIAQLLEALSSFVLEVAQVTVAIPKYAIQGSFDAAITTVTSHGIVGAVSSLLLLSIGLSLYGLGVRLIARN